MTLTSQWPLSFSVLIFACAFPHPTLFSATASTTPHSTWSWTNIAEELQVNSLDFIGSYLHIQLTSMGSASSKSAKAAGNVSLRRYPKQPSPSATSRSSPNAAGDNLKVPSSEQRAFSPKDQQASSKKTECTRFYQFRSPSPFARIPYTREGRDLIIGSNIIYYMAPD
jgi:hypothetical protein